MVELPDHFIIFPKNLRPTGSLINPLSAQALSTRIQLAMYFLWDVRVNWVSVTANARIEGNCAGRYLD